MLVVPLGPSSVSNLHLRPSPTSSAEGETGGDAEGTVAEAGGGAEEEAGGSKV